ncbi:MAG: hypothetical protein IAG13_23215, partial [Deltaproteobacteria bacterium]|nr:hypothetical protein [Nannocystaceae bacterium]
RAAAATRWSIGWHTDAAAIEATLAAFGEAFALTVVDAPLAGAEDNA